MQDALTIRTLGVFSVGIGDRPLSDTSNRSQKLWKIFKYLLTNRHKMISVETLIGILWPESEPDNPQKSLHTLMSRLRKQLNPDGEGDSYILFQHGCYQWNPKLPIDLDVAEFEKMITNSAETQDDEEKLVFLKKAVDMYQGDYLSEATFEAWVLPVSNYYKRLYLRTVLDLVEVCKRASAYEDIAEICIKAIENEPYEENLYEYLIQALLINGEIARAQRYYHHFSELMQKAFGAKPSEEFRALSQGMWENEGEEFNLFDIKRKLDGEPLRRGAFFCTTDTFNQIYQLDKRSDERMKFPVFLCLITVSGKTEAPIEEKLVKSASLALRQCLMRTLRQGDIVSQYSKNQFLLLLSAYYQKDAESALNRVQHLFADEADNAPFELKINLSQIGN
ncbi:MAG: winged helix-turn-helix domain-containing protein [Peptococcaceae bacterium]|jgi:DNA-binding SARP family transcriptional activator|nr:winged helix-turn-helix domain-containing protein [Peptococcaceae bacterium]